MSTESLYDKYGGFGGISGVVHDFYKRIQASPSLKKFFANSDMDKLIDHQIKFLCKVLGGPDNYDGRTLDRAHKTLKIDDKAFEEVGGHLKAALEAAGVEAQDVNTILSVVESVRSNIVTVKAKAEKAPEAAAPKAEKPSAPPPASETLYDKYGGFGGISGVVHDFYKRIQASASLKRFFANTDMDKLIDHQIKFLCKVLGGPDNYDGKSLDRAHKMMKIDDKSFNEVGGHLSDALTAAGVEAKDVKTILGVVESVRSNIVTVKENAPAPAAQEAAPAPAASAPVAQEAAPAPAASAIDRIPITQVMSSAFALVHPKTLTLTYANPKFSAWTGIEELPTHLEAAFDPKVFAGVKEQLQQGKELITFEADSTPKEGAKIPVEYTLRMIDWRDGRYVLTGLDMSRVKEKDLMLKSFTQVIEVNNKKLKNEQKAVAELLDNMKQAVFTFTSDFKISKRYSKFVHTLFGDEVQVADRDAMDVIFESSDISESDRAKFTMEMNFAFANGEFQWSISSMDFPKQVKKTIGDDTKDIKLVFEPIFADDTLQKVMVVMEDMTAFNKAKREAEEKSKELERVSQLMACNAEHFAVFESEIWPLFERCKTALADLRQSISKQKPELMKANIDDLFRHVHTIKGNARSIHLKSVQEVAHQAEDFVSKMRDAGTAEFEDLPGLEQKIDYIRNEVQSYCDLRASIFGNKNNSASSADTIQMIELIQKVSDASKQGGSSLTEAIKNLDDKRKQICSALQASILQRYESLVGDIAAENGKKVLPINFKGDIIAFSKAAKGQLNEILTHALRNSIDHGIESPEDRKQKGKAEAGQITIQYDLSDNVYTLLIADDGQGLQTAKIKAKALEKNFISQQEAAQLTDNQIAELLFQPGFSTANKVSEISGRGVGMDAVRKAAHELGGDVTIGNARTGGTELLVILPIKAEPLKKAS